MASNTKTFHEQQHSGCFIYIQCSPVNCYLLKKQRKQKLTVLTCPSERAKALIQLFVFEFHLQSFQFKIRSVHFNKPEFIIVCKSKEHLRIARFNPCIRVVSKLLPANSCFLMTIMKCFQLKQPHPSFHGDITFKACLVLY